MKKSEIEKRIKEVQDALVTAQENKARAEAHIEEGLWILEVFYSKLKELK